MPKITSNKKKKVMKNANVLLDEYNAGKLTRFQLEVSMSAISSLLNKYDK